MAKWPSGHREVARDVSRWLLGYSTCTQPRSAPHAHPNTHMCTFPLIHSLPPLSFTVLKCVLLPNLLHLSDFPLRHCPSLTPSSPFTPPLAPLLYRQHIWREYLRAQLADFPRTATSPLLAYEREIGRIKHIPTPGTLLQPPHASIVHVQGGNKHGQILSNSSLPVCQTKA
jgi:hypothetical protein